MSDSRFARLKTDPRFRRIRKKESKVVVDDRFKSIFDEGEKGKKGKGKEKGRVDKYGRALSNTHEKDNLRRFYRLEGEDEEAEESSKKPDYARGEVILESSDEEENARLSDGEDSDTGGVVILGQDSSKPIPVPEDELEFDLDEDNFADLDAQAEAYAKSHENDHQVPEANRTRRLAVVNLDWDHVRAIHLYKIFSSIVSPTASVLPSLGKDKGGRTTNVMHRMVHGRVLSVRVYPSQFGKERMAREEKEGPPPEIFKKNNDDGEEVNEKNIHETGDADADYNEDALRKYQLERLRYYYAVVECDSVEAASHIYSELDGTELERSANVFDLSFIPEDMSFDDEIRDEAKEDVNGPYKALEFTTDALRHSKVKLTWDDDDPERNHITRRALTRKEIEENDFRAYLASDTESEDEGSSAAVSRNKASRDKLRALLLGGGDDTLPEGWGKDDNEGDVDMEITFTPGLSEKKNPEEETTLEKYQRKMKEKRQKKKGEKIEKTTENTKAPLDDEFFGNSSNEDENEDEQGHKEVKKKGRDKKQPMQKGSAPRMESTAEELALIAASDNPNADPKHFDMKAVLRAEKKKGKGKKSKKSNRAAEEENELQEDFAIDVKDERFNALHEDHTFAIDPSNPHFKKTKSMAALLEERGKRQKGGRGLDTESRSTSLVVDSSQPNLKSLVESVKRKSAIEGRGQGKRRRL